MILNQRIEAWLAAQRPVAESAKRPFVTLSYAQGWDGSITTRAGESLGLSGAESLRLTHQLRSLHDGILVGIGTVLTDDPQLTVREWPGANPQPIVLDSRLRMPPTARLCQRADKTCWVLTRLKATGGFDGKADIITLEADAEGRVNLREALSLLWQKGIRTLMVEGGSHVITAFLKAQLADALVLTIAPTLVGGYKGVGNLEIGCKSRLPQIRPLYSQMLGDDLIMWGNLRYLEQTDW
ncbi:RibD family protein [Methylomonas sp. SURF-2]|uniref:RibD family protein n=1 Tax=Methylomonas subterranea TaxID=2952225 RepID=A0ABT1TLV4_9GAMM|nr:RibD family protein [Methylomonas sp. SURF-2]MCQ8106203.1 RibD family protein [Methylomonas sp. SURF-2]